MIRIDHVALYTGKESFRDGAVLVEGDRILYAGDRTACPPAEGAQHIHGGGGILMPGFYNGHCHAAMTLERGVGSDLNLHDWLHMIWPIEANLTPEIVYWGTMHANMEMLMRGCLGYADMYFFEDQVGRAALGSGIRVNLSRGCMNSEEADSIRALYRDWHGKGEGRIRVSMGVHGEYTSTTEMVRHAVEVGNELGAGFHVHMSETRFETDGCLERRGVTPTRYFYELGMLTGHTLCAHCVHLNDEDIRLMAESGACMVHNPASNMKLASGFAPVERMRKAGVKVALGTDGASSNNTLDMLADMRLASILQKGLTGDPTALNAADSITMATHSGAQAMGWDAGLIEEGRQADMILLDGNAGNLIPMPDIPAAIVYAAQGLNVTMSMVQGKVLYRDGEFTTLDPEEVKRKALEAARKLGVG